MHHPARRLSAFSLALLTSCASLVVPLAVEAAEVREVQRAAMPAAMDLMPMGAPLVFGIPSLDALDEGFVGLMRASEQTTISSLREVLGILGVREALDTSGSMACAVWPGEEGVRWLMVVQARSAADLEAALRGAPSGNGGFEFTFNGIDYAGRSYPNNLVAISPDPKLADATLNPGQAVGWDAVVPGACAEHLQDPMFVIVDAEVISSMLPTSMPIDAEAADGEVPDWPIIEGGDDRLASIRAGLEGGRLVLGVRPQANGLWIGLAGTFPGEPGFTTALRGDHAEGIEPFAQLPLLQSPLLVAGIDATHPGGAAFLSALSGAWSPVFEGARTVNLALVANAGALSIANTPKAIVRWSSEEAEVQRAAFEKLLVEAGGSYTERSNDTPFQSYALPGDAVVPIVNYGPGVVAVRDGVGFIATPKNAPGLPAMLKAEHEQSMMRDRYLRGLLRGMPIENPFGALMLDVRTLLLSAKPMLPRKDGVELYLPDKFPPLFIRVGSKDGVLLSEHYFSPELIRNAIALARSGMFSATPADDSTESDAGKPGNANPGNANPSR